MNKQEIMERMNKVFREVFDNDHIAVKEETTASDVEGWDSLTHITLIFALEEQFGVKLAMKEVLELKNVGQMADCVLRYLE